LPYTREPVHARFVYLLFLDDPRSPTSADNWHKATGDARQRLGLEKTPPGMAYVHFPAVKNPIQFILRQPPEPNDMPL
jgi:hypothetical protein